MKLAATPLLSAAAFVFGATTIFPSAVAQDITRGERVKHSALGERFDKLDRNGDGILTASETPSKALFQRLDLDGDGKLGKPEAARAIAQGALKGIVDVAPSQADDSTPPEPAPSESDAPIRQGPQPLKPNDYGVGRMVPDLSFTDLDSVTHKLSDYRDRKAVVLALTGTGCPLCLKYAPSLADIEKRYRDHGVEFIFINPNESENNERLRQAIDRHGFQGSYVRDGDMRLPHALGATSTTEVFVIDQARTLVYRGAVDDQYGFGYALDEPRHHYLVDAIDSVLSGIPVDVAATSSPGCELYYGNDLPKESTATVTYHNQVARIIQANCIECHRDGGIAPMAFESYQQVKDYAGMIRNVINRRIMPPWFAAESKQKTNPSAAAQTEHDTLHDVPRWANERSLSDAERSDLFAWIEGGAPEGDPNDAPLPKQFPDGWLIGKPDAEFGFDQPQQVKATGTMPYQNVTVKTNLAEDKWVSAIEVRPGNPSVVHHVIVSVRGSEGRIDERDGFWGVYVPGNSTLVYPKGYAKRLPKGATLRFQMHYTPNGTATEDVTRIGVIFADKPPKHEVKVKGIANGKFRIPAGDDNYKVTEDLKLGQDVRVLGFLPHMHLRGKAARYELLSAGDQEVLLDIPRYDFNWQLLYRLTKPQTLHRGETIRFTAWYDNSENNPANPDPTREIKWGPQTEDEMHLGYVEYIVPGVTPEETPETAASFDAALFARLDRNQDDLITRDEVRRTMPGNAKAAGPIFTALDRNGDEKLDKDEFKRLAEVTR